MSSVLEFPFKPSDYFTNEVLTKTWRMRSEPDDSDPILLMDEKLWVVQGARQIGEKGHNVPLKTIKKKQKHKGHGTVRTVTKTVSNDSFIFLPLLKFLSGDLGDDAEAILTTDFETGHCLREHIILKSVLYFTREATEDDDDDDYNEGEENDKNNPDYGSRRINTWQSACSREAR